MIKKILGIISLLLLASTLLCGFWMHSTGRGDIVFHMQLGTAAVIVSCVAIVLLLIKK